MQDSMKSMRVLFVQQPGNYSSIYVLLSSLKFSETKPKVVNILAEVSKTYMS